jgi:hypothetical protein
LNSSNFLKVSHGFTHTLASYFSPPSLKTPTLAQFSRIAHLSCRRLPLSLNIFTSEPTSHCTLKSLATVIPIQKCQYRIDCWENKYRIRQWWNHKRRGLTRGHNLISPPIDFFSTRFSKQRNLRHDTTEAIWLWTGAVHK